ncbi:MAG: hypothetical protein ACRDG8_02290 [Actinomycetota bacterium]
MAATDRWSRSRLGPFAVAAVSLLVAAIIVVSNLDTTSRAPSAPDSPAPRTGEEMLVATTLEDLPAALRPYPYTEPTPAPVPTDIDGTYMLILTLEDLGGASAALPFPCRRCLPYARDPGVLTLIFFEGAYFVDHQMSGFHSTGHYGVEGNMLTLFNDPNCTRERGTYRWRMDGASLRLSAIEDTCPFQGERATDLASDVWTRIPVCRREVQHLWPGILGC